MKDQGIYPSFIYAENRGQIFSWIELPMGYEELLPFFYTEGGKERIEAFTRHLENTTEDIFGKTEIKLRWDLNRGLENISIGASGGLDLNKTGHHFVEHNLGTRTSLITGAIAINYVNELLKISRRSEKYL